MSRNGTVALLLALSLAGCPGNPGEPTGPATPDPAGARDRQIQRLRAELDMANARLEELRLRNERLSRKLSELKFLNSQLHKQLAAVGDAPRQRDQYKAEALRQRLLIEKLRSQLERMSGGRTGGASGTTTLPARGGG